MKSLKLISPALLLMLSACGWVDSTGKQLNAEAVVVDPTILLLESNAPVQIRENTQRTIVFNGANKRISNWNWTLLEGQGNFNQCQGINGFDQSIATNSLSQACAFGNFCQLSVVESAVDNVTQFQITAPFLRAPAALEVSFTARSANGLFVEERHTICALAINDAPIAVEDRVVVLRGTQLNVRGDSTQSLLANDRDDVDIRNRPLRVDPTPVRAPRFASDFRLFPDGGFVYEPLQNAPLSSNGSISDSFTYLISDGNQTSTATVSIKINNFNSAPLQKDALPDTTVNVGEFSSSQEITYLQSYFSDAENDSLSFEVLNDSLPESGNLYVTSDGVLEGMVSEDDTGIYFVNIAVSDSLETIEASFILNVVGDRESNRSPTVDDISNKIVSGTFSYDVSEFFVDLDGDNLYFTAINLPEGLIITPDGVIKGTADEDNRGTWVIRVKAEDGSGEDTDDGFRLTIR